MSPSTRALCTCPDTGDIADMSARRVQKFRADYAEFRAQFEKYKAEVRVPCIPSHRTPPNVRAHAFPSKKRPHGQNSSPHHHPPQHRSPPASRDNAS